MVKNKNEKTTLLDKIIRGHLYLLILLIPLIFWLDTETIFTLPKLLVLRTLGLSAILFILFKFFRDREFRLVFPSRTLFLGFWLGSVLLSTIFSINSITSVFGQYGRYMGFLTYFNLALIPIYMASFFTAKDLKKLLGFSVFTAVLVALYGLLQYFNFFGLWSAPFDWTDSPQNRVFSTIGHANHLAAYLAAHLLILAYGINPSARQRRWYVLVGQLLGIILFAWVLILTASRGAVLALVLSALVLFVLKAWKHRLNFRKKFGKILIGLLLVCLLLVSGFYLLSQQLGDLSIVKRTEDTINNLEGGVVPERLSFMYSAFAMFLDHPLLGTGFSTFRDAYSAYRRTDYIISGPGNAQYITVPESAHDEYVNILATQGIVGLLTYLALLVVLFRFLIYRFGKASLADENYYLAVTGALLVFATQTIFNFGEIVNWFLFFFLMGLAFVEDQKTAEWRCRLPKAAWYPLIILIFVLVAFGFKEGVLAEGQADYFYRQAVVAQAQDKTALADQYYQVAIAAKPLEYQLHQAYGDFSIAAAYTVDNNSTKSAQTYLLQSAQEYEHALALDPNYPSTYHNLALAYLQIYRITKNKSYLDQSQQNYLLSIQKSPNNPRYLYEYARKLHTDWNDRIGAVRLLRQALLIAPNYQEPQDYLNFLYKNYPELKSV